MSMIPLSLIKNLNKNNKAAAYETIKKIQNDLGKFASWVGLKPPSNVSNMLSYNYEKAITRNIQNDVSNMLSYNYAKATTRNIQNGFYADVVHENFDRLQKLKKLWNSKGSIEKRLKDAQGNDDAKKRIQNEMLETMKTFFMTPKRSPPPPPKGDTFRNANTRAGVAIRPSTILPSLPCQRRMVMAATAPLGVTALMRARSPLMQYSPHPRPPVLSPPVHLTPALALLLPVFMFAYLLKKVFGLSKPRIQRALNAGRMCKK